MAEPARKPVPVATPVVTYDRRPDAYRHMLSMKKIVIADL